MLSFRKKIFLSDFILLAIFVAFLFPFIEITVSSIMKNSLTDRGKVMIGELQKASDNEEMIEIMKSRAEFIFQPVSILDGQGNIIYHSHLPDVDLKTISEIQRKEPEIQEAIQGRIAFNEHVSPFFHQKFYFVAIPFTAHGEKFILHVNFRADEIDKLKKDFEIGVLKVSLILLLVTTLLDLIIVHLVTRPIQQIVSTIRPFQEGKEELLPKIVLDKAMQGSEFSKLASTLNALTERIQRQIENLTRQREETEEILESIGEGIIATDTSAKVSFVNRTACRMLNVRKENLLRQTLTSIQSSDLSKKCHELVLHSLQTSESTTQTWLLKDGSIRYLDLISAPLAHQNGALIVLQDKTSDYKIVEMGKDFIANASHELRTPITIIRGFAETLQDLPELSQEMLHEITEKIVRTCGRLDKLVRSLLTLADIENLSDERFNPTDLVVLSENCKHYLLTAHPEVDISFKSDHSSVMILADSDLIELAISNLLENAVKYSQDHPKIDMQIRCDHESAFLSVTDHGIGISEHDLHHIFDRFYTVDKARSRKSGGAGLGLSIVKTVIEKHGGGIRVSSKMGEGSIFTIIMPLYSVK